MELKKIHGDFTICKIKDVSKVNWAADFCFIGKTDEEISLVCLSEDVPENVIQMDEGWSAFRIQGILDFSLTGILSGIATVLADSEIGIFAVSTYNTDYILTKAENHSKAMLALAEAGYQIVS